MLEVDRAQIARFCSALFRYVTPGSFVSLRSFKDADVDIKQWPHPAVTVDDIEGPATAFAQRCANASFPVVFCPPVATFSNPTHARGADLVDGLALSVECDANGQRAWQKLELLLGPPTMVVASGGLWRNDYTGLLDPKLHLHWRLARPARAPEEHEQLKALRRAACKFVGADTTNIPMVHPIRWPGSWHRKAEPRMAQIVAESENEIRLDLALDVIPEVQLREHSEPEHADIDEVRLLLMGIPLGESQSKPGQRSWSEWNRIGMAIYGATGGSRDGMLAFEEWSRKHFQAGRQTAKSRWAHYDRHPPTELGVGTLRYLHAQHFVDDRADMNPETIREYMEQK